MSFTVQIFKMRLFILGIVLLQFCRCENEDCKKVKNIEAIDKCPATKQEWTMAALKKNCAKLVSESPQNCSESLKYHCLINSFRNQTMEMCALKRILRGGCPEFNDVGRLIQKHKYSPCNKTEFPSCVGLYNSTEAYQYQGCYKLVNKTTSELVNKTSEKSNEGHSTKLLPIILGSLIVICIICIGTVVTVLGIKGKINICKKRVRRNGSSDIRVPVEENVELLPVQEKSNPEPKIIVRNESDAGTATDKSVFALLKSTEDLSEENKDESKRFLKCYKTIDDYFVETAMYKKGEETFRKYGIVIWTGNSGCGKTIAAIHLIRKQMLDANKTCTFRKIRSWQELKYIERDEKTLIFIDNIFFRRTIDLDLENWWNELDKIHHAFFQNTELTDRLRFVITAQANVMERVCLFMQKTTPILNLDRRIKTTELTEEEKEDILTRQIEFAKKERKAQIPKINADFLSKVKSSEGPIGFPLCAHLFACKKEYQKSGAAFFSRPIEYLKFQIKDEIESDRSNRTKSLFFVLFFHEWHTKSGNAEILNIRSEFKCRKFLEKISKDLLKKFKPFDFRDLEREAQKLVGTFLKEDARVYTFIHDSVYEAVGALWCETYIVETARYFPLEIIQKQEYEDITTKQDTVLATRLLYELLNEKLSVVFACRMFKRRSFVDLFLIELTKKDRKTVINFLTVANDSSQVKLPPMFWASCNKLTYLTEKMYASVTESNIQPDYQLYALLFGDCCARKESLLKPLNGMLKDNLEGIKRQVLQFKDDDENCIIHLVITSERSDDFAAASVEKLLNDKNEFVDARNKEKITPLMLAVDQSTKREKVIEKLMKKSPKLFYKDTGGSNVFHHCLASRQDDETCAKYLKIILTGNDSVKCLMKDDANGNTVLCKAAMETKHSRICSILKLLEYGKTHIMKTMSDEGFSPLHLSVTCLQAESADVELECCVRVILLLLCGDSPDNKSDTNVSAIEQCKYSVVKNILQHPEDKSVMVTALDSILENIKECRDVCSSTVFPPFPKEIDLEIQNRIKQAIQILKNKTLV